jgi:hypothetical protein
VNIYYPTDKDLEKKKTVWGQASRDSGKPKNDAPSPNTYSLSNGVQGDIYSFPRSSKTDEAKAYKSSFAPGPGAYEIRRDDK